MMEHTGKVIETARKDSISQALSIWAEIKELDEDASSDKAIEEYELSMRTWLDCVSEKHYEKHKDKYQRLNDAVKDAANEIARESGWAHPLLKRHHNRIGKMTLTLGHNELSYRVKCIGTHMKKGVGINEGLGLGRNVPAEIVHDFATKLIEGGYDPRYAAQLAVETVKEIAANNELAEKLGKMKYKKLRNDLTKDVLKALNSRPAIVENDKRLLALGVKDTLIKRNKNVAGEKDETKESED